jgi:hypothetical protein
MDETWTCLVEKHDEKQPLRTHNHRWKDIYRVQEGYVRALPGFIRLNIGASGRLLYTR